MGQRKKARELTLKCLYAYESTGEATDSICQVLIQEAGLSPEAAGFAEALFCKVSRNLEELDVYIKEALEHWDFDRIAMVDRNILRLGICELLYFPDIPAKVTINEAVELAKKYSAQESSRFVNGVLDAVNKRLAKATHG